MYLYGAEFTLLTDHKPLECIYSTTSNGKSSARIHRWVLRLQTYRFTVKYIPGKQNIADSLSRLIESKGNNSSTQPTDAETYVRFVAQNATPNALSTRQIEEESAVDEELCNVRKCIKTQRWHELTNKRYLAVKDELCIIGMLVLRGTRIVIPETLRETVLKLAHEGHPGIVSMKRRIRTKVWWFGIDKDSEQFCKTCYSCQLLGSTQAPEPMKTTELPSGPWQHVSADLMSLPSGDYIFVVVDYYSRYFEVDTMKSTTTDKIVRSLGKMFLTHGFPISITTDNGPQFVSELFKDYLAERGIEHRRVTPLWPQANGEVERQNRSLLKSVRIAQLERKDWKTELDSFLLMYRTTPHSVTGVSPAELLFKRKLRTRIPGIEEHSVDDIEVRDRNNENKMKGKLYADGKRNARENDLKTGDDVLLRQERQNKLTPKYQEQPYTVKAKSGNSVLIERDGVQYKRNVTHVKKFLKRTDGQNRSELSKPTSINRDTPIVDIDEESIPCKTDECNDRETVTENASMPTSSVLASPRPVRVKTMPHKFKDYEVTLK
ncbi:uncharacterized protein K02A2.6-like [Mizuhopecten yessoensis]|nr:uncharacterized protein K02A2.6-like [Mizuhopecten yessoensis]